MTSMLHRLETHDPYETKLQSSTLRYVVTSRAYATGWRRTTWGYP